MTENLRQQFVQTGVPAAADALTALSQQLTQVTGQLQRAARQLSACTGVAEQARRAIDHVSTSVATATDTARWAVVELTHQVGVEGRRAVCLLCGAAWLLGVLAGLAFDRWRGVGVAVVPQAIAVPAPLAAPSSAAESTPKKPMRDTPHPRRDSHAPIGPTSERPRGTVMEQRSNSDGTAPGTHDAKPEA